MRKDIVIELSYKGFSLYYSHLFRYERSKYTCISVSAVMTMQNVVNPTFKEEERASS